MNLDENVGKTKYTVGWVVKKLEASDAEFRNFAKNGILKVEQKSLSGIGYLSFIIRLSFYFGIDDEEPFKVICKIPTTDMIYNNFKRSDNKKDSNHHKDTLPEYIKKAHNRECHIYTSVVPFLKMNTPRIYCTEEKDDEREGCIIMEDISENGTLHNILKPMNLQQIEAVIKSIAEMHAKSQALPQKLFETLKFDNVIEVPKDCLRGLFKLVDSKIIQNYKTEIEEAWDETSLVDSHLKYGISPVISHGDCWINNIFFYKNEDGKASEKVYTFLDWQLTHRGNGLNDVARFLAISVEADILQIQRDYFLKLYCDYFNQCSTSSNSYTLEMVQKMIKEHTKSELSFLLPLLFNFYAHSKDKETKERILKKMEQVVTFCFYQSDS